MNGMNQERRAEFTDRQIQQIQQLLEAGFKPVHDQLKDGEGRMDGLASDLSDLKAKQEFNNRKTNEMFEAFDFAKKGLRALGWIGSVITKAWPIWASIAAYCGWKGWKK